MPVILLRDTPFSWLPQGAKFLCYDMHGEHEKVSQTHAYLNGAVYAFGPDDIVRYRARPAPYEFTFVALGVGEKFKHMDFACELEKINLNEAMTAYGTVHPIADCSPVTR